VIPEPVRQPEGTLSTKTSTACRKFILPRRGRSGDEEGRGVHHGAEYCAEGVAVSARARWERAKKATAQYTASKLSMTPRSFRQRRLTAAVAGISSKGKARTRLFIASAGRVNSQVAQSCKTPGYNASRCIGNLRGLLAELAGKQGLDRIHRHGRQRPVLTIDGNSRPSMKDVQGRVHEVRAERSSPTRCTA